jgi:hypothetical protein
LKSDLFLFAAALYSFSSLFAIFVASFIVVQLFDVQPDLIVSEKLLGFPIDQCHFVANHVKRTTGNNTLRTCIRLRMGMDADLADPCAGSLATFLDVRFFPELCPLYPQ